MASRPSGDGRSLSRSLPMNCGVSRPSGSSAHRNHPGKRHAALPFQQRGVFVDLFGTKLPRQLTADGADSSGSDAADELAESVPHACRDTRFTRPWFLRLGRPGGRIGLGRLGCLAIGHAGVLASTHHERGGISGRRGWLLVASAPPHARSQRRTRPNSHYCTWSRIHHAGAPVPAAGLEGAWHTCKRA